MKKAICILLAGIIILSPTKYTQAKTICVDMNHVTKSYLTKHKADTVYAYVKGKRTKANGDGIDTHGYYIKYHKGKVGVKYTSVFRYKKGTVAVDDTVDRVDYKGWSTPFSH